MYCTQLWCYIYCAIIPVRATYIYYAAFTVRASTALMLFVCSYDDAVYSEWSGGVDEVAKASLEKSLLLRDPVVMHLTVNFDPKVMPMLYVWSWVSMKREWIFHY